MVYVYICSCQQHIIVTKLSTGQITNCVWCMVQPSVLQVLRHDILHRHIVSPLPNPQPRGTRSVYLYAPGNRVAQLYP